MSGDVVGGETLLSLGSSAATATGLIPPGTIVAGYRIEDRAGAGGMGIVYRATDTQLERPVALKVIAPELAADERFRELFIEESRRAAALEHPNIIPIYRSGEEDGLLYIAMRFVDGASLQELIARRGRLTVGAAVRIVEQIADALDHSHAHGLVHRDVKPGNVLVTQGGGEPHVYLTDFGLAIPIADSRSSHGRYAGTPAYLSPEQIRDEPVDGRTDVYSLGCVLFHCLTGRVPFTGPGFEAKVVAHLTERPPAATLLVVDLPQGLDEVIRRAMAKRPDDRYGSAGELAAAARDARADVVICHHPDDAPAAQTIRDRLQARDVEARTSAHDSDVDLWSARACLLVVGRRDLAEWAGDLLAHAGDVAAHDLGFEITSVLLPGAPDPFAPDLAFLAGRPFVDLRSGLDDGDAMADLLRAVGQPGRHAPATSSDTPPYRGLEAFQEDDSDLFFGRSQDIVALLEKLRTGRFLAVLGASGSGKSSLIRAGVLPTLRREPGTTVTLLTPGARPLAALAAALDGATGTSAPTADELLDDTRALDRAARTLPPGDEPGRLVVVVDQFEETFSLASSAEERRAFVDNLVFAATIPGGPATVILAMRSDFYHRSAEHTALRALIAERQFLVGPLGPEGLRAAIEEPAHASGLELERGLVRRILSDVSDEPGALPLMEHLLLELWERRRGRLLTLEGYAAAGGVAGALAQHADDAFERLDEEQQEIARGVLLRLTQPGEGTEDTRRRALVSELATSDEDETAVRQVVGSLVDARLLVLSTDDASDDPSVEVTHEALIRGWPRLRSWIEADRESLRLHRRLTDAAQEWSSGGRDDSALYRGTRLALWDGRDTTALNPLERSFLDASSAQAAREAATRKKRLRLAFGGMGAAVAFVSGVAAFGFVQRDNAAEQRDLARSREVAANAREQLPGDPELSLLLAMRAHAIAPTIEAEEILRRATAESRIRRTLRGHTGTVNDVTYAGDGARIATAGQDGTIRIWETTGAGDPISLTGHEGPVHAVRFADAGRSIISAGEDGTVRRSTINSRQSTVLVRHEGPALSIDIASDGAIVASGGADGLARIWTESADRPDLVLRGHSGPVFAVAVSTDARVIATGGEDLRVRFWNATDGSLERTGAELLNSIQSIALSPDGRRYVVERGDGSLILDSVTAGSSRPRTMSGHQAGVSGVAFSSDGRVVASAGTDGTVRVWDVATGASRSVLRGHPDAVQAVSFDPTGRFLASASTDGVRIWEWDAGAPLTTVVPGPARGGVAFNDSGDEVLAGSFYAGLTSWMPTTGRLTVLQPEDRSRPVGELVIAPQGKLVARLDFDGNVFVGPSDREAKLKLDPGATAIAASPDGRTLGIATTDGGLMVQVTGQGTPTEVGRTEGGPATNLAVSNSGDLVTASPDGVVMVWRAGAQRAGVEVARHAGGVFALAFSPDGRWVVSGGRDRIVRIRGMESTSTVIDLQGFSAPTYRASFTQDGTLLATMSDDGVRIWDWRRGMRLFQASNIASQDGAISPDGTTVASLDFADGTLRHWTCETCGPLDDVLKLARTRTTRRLSAAEAGLLSSDEP